MFADRNDHLRHSVICKCLLAGSLLAIAGLSVNSEAIGEEREIIIFRGFGGHWPKAKELQQKFERKGYKTRVVWCHHRKQLFNEIREKQRHGVDAAPVALIGFSLGATNAQFLSYDLLSLGIEVPLLVLIDGPVMEFVPQNVRHCVHMHRQNFFESHLSKSMFHHRFIPTEHAMVHLTRGCEIRPLSSRSRVENLKLGRESDLTSFLSDNHLTLCGTSEFQESLVERVAEVLSSQPESSRGLKRR